MGAEKKRFASGSKADRPRSLKEALETVLSAEEKKILVSGFDTLGNIAIIEIPEELEKKERLIGETLLKLNKNLETVCKKTGAHKGKFRVEPVKVIAGKKKLVASYKEFGCSFRIHIGKVFFSPRLSRERQRINALIKPGETIGAFFAGVGPFPIVFAKNSRMKKAVAIELNPVAVKDMEFNIRQNKVSEKVMPVLGDVKKVVPKKYRGLFDRVVMPLPKGAQDFFREALVSLNPKGGVIHFYAFAPAANPFEELENHLKSVAEKNGFSLRFSAEHQVRTFSKELIQVVLDCVVKKKK